MTDYKSSKVVNIDLQDSSVKIECQPDWCLSDNRGSIFIAEVRQTELAQVDHKQRKHNETQATKDRNLFSKWQDFAKKKGHTQGLIVQTNQSETANR